MAEGTLTNYIRRIVAKAEPYIPQVPKPKKRYHFKQNYCGVGLVLLSIW